MKISHRRAWCSMRVISSKSLYAECASALLASHPLNEMTNILACGDNSEEKYSFECSGECQSMHWVLQPGIESHLSQNTASALSRIQDAVSKLILLIALSHPGRNGR